MLAFKSGNYGKRAPVTAFVRILKFGENHPNILSRQKRETIIVYLKSYLVSILCHLFFIDKNAIKIFFHKSKGVYRSFFKTKKPLPKTACGGNKMWTTNFLALTRERERERERKYSFDDCVFPYDN